MVATTVGKAKAFVPPEKPSYDRGAMSGTPLDTAEWESVLFRMHRYHANIGEELKQLIVAIKKEMKEEMVPVAEDKANYGKVVKQGIRSMWNLEYEIEDIQKEFAKSIGSIDLEHLTDDFVEDVMLQSKPLQSVLYAIRKRQKEQMELIKKEYGDKIEGLEPLSIPRPPKPVPKPAEPEKKPEEAAAPKEGEAPKEGGEAPKPAEGEPLPAEPAPATADMPAAPAVEASA